MIRGTKSRTRQSLGLAADFRFVFAISVLSLLISTGCVSKEKKQNEASLRLEIGTAFLSQGNYPSALRELLLAEQLDADNAMVQNNLGLVYFFRQHYPEAAKHLSRAVELQPKFGEARNNYGRVLIELRNYDKAIAQLKVVLADLTYPEPTRTYVNLGLAYYYKGDYPMARLEFTEALRLDRNHCLGQDMYGRTLLELGEFQNAAQALDNAVLICKSTKFEEPSYFSGLTYYKLGKTSFAIARMEEVVKLNPDGPYAKKAESMLKLMK